MLSTLLLSVLLAGVDDLPDNKSVAMNFNLMAARITEEGKLATTVTYVRIVNETHTSQGPYSVTLPSGEVVTRIGPKTTQTPRTVVETSEGYYSKGSFKVWRDEKPVDDATAASLLKTARRIVLVAADDFDGPGKAKVLALFRPEVIVVSVRVLPLPVPAAPAPTVPASAAPAPAAPAPAPVPGPAAPPPPPMLMPTPAPAANAAYPTAP